MLSRFAAAALPAVLGKQTGLQLLSGASSSAHGAVTSCGFRAVADVEVNLADRETLKKYVGVRDHLSKQPATRGSLMEALKEVLDAVKVMRPGFCVLRPAAPAAVPLPARSRPPQCCCSLTAVIFSKFAGGMQVLPASSDYRRAVEATTMYRLKVCQRAPAQPCWP
jgi:hypothetical protein